MRWFRPPPVRTTGTHSIPEVLLRYRTSEVRLTVVLLAIAAGVAIAGKVLSPHTPRMAPLLVVGTVLLLLFLSHVLLRIRIHLGFYGRNEYEVRELIKFVLLDARYDDLNRPGGGRREVESTIPGTHNQTVPLSGEEVEA